MILSNMIGEQLFCREQGVTPGALEGHVLKELRRPRVHPDKMAPERRLGERDVLAEEALLHLDALLVVVGDMELLGGEAGEG